MRTLIIDDDDLSSFSLKRLIGGEVRRYTSLSQALEKAPDWEPDYIVMDVNLPPEPRQAVRNVRKLHGAYPDAILVVWTGDYDETEAVKCTNCGAYAYLEKGDVERLRSLLDGASFGVP